MQTTYVQERFDVGKSKYFSLFLRRKVFDISYFPICTGERILFTERRLCTRRQVYFITFQPTDIRQSLFSIRSTSLRSAYILSLYSRLILTIPIRDFDDAICPPWCTYTNTIRPLLAKGNVIAYADFASSRVCSMSSTNGFRSSRTFA